MLTLFRALWTYRGFILGSVKREFQSKYRNSLLGAAWTVLNPLAMIVVYTVIFAEVMRAKLPGVDNTFGYSIYLCAGLLTWGLFAEIVGRAQTVFIDNANLLKKLSFPRLCLPVVIVVSALLNFTIIFGLFSLFLLISGNFPGLPYLALAPLLAILILFSIGLGIIVGVLNVFFRDIGQFFGIFLTFWFWLTPIVYPASTLPENMRWILACNPVAPLMAGFQTILVNRLWPQWESLWWPGLLCLALCAGGMALFRKHAGEMVDEL
ncbi:MAG: ABC transporter permease [Candidatus Accumulibacter sp.]|jgi:lipopolysaccharide transport system permease protein|nr:ABC transporter permease [Accumulibacter sp.]